MNQKVKYKTGNEIFVIVLRRVNEEAFLAFAGNEPFYVTEDNDEVERMVEQYFPLGATDVLPEDPDEEEDYYDYEDEAEEEEDYEDVYEDETDVPPSIVDLSMFWDKKTQFLPKNKIHQKKHVCLHFS